MTGRVRIKRGDVWAERLREHLTTSGLGAAEWMEDHTQILRSDIHSMSGLLQIEDQLAYLKLYRFRSVRHRLQVGLGITQPLRSFSTARALVKKGIAVPQPLACLRVSQGMLLLTEGLSGGGNLADLWHQGACASDGYSMMRAAGETLAKVHAAGYIYGNCRWEKMFWDGQRVYLINLDSTRKGPLGGIEQSRDLARFTVNSEELAIGSVLFEQFLEAYLQGVTGTRGEVVERMIRPLYRFRGQTYTGYGQRLV